MPEPHVRGFFMQKLNQLPEEKHRASKGQSEPRAEATGPETAASGDARRWASPVQHQKHQPLHPHQHPPQQLTQQSQSQRLHPQHQPLQQQQQEERSRQLQSGARMNLNSLKDPNGQASNGGAAAAASIPSLKRTLSGGSTGVHGHASSGVSGMGGMSSMPSVMHANTNTNPPQMLRAVTSSGVFNRPGSSTNASRNITGSSTSLTSNSLGSGMGSAGGARNNSGSSMSDWRMYLTIEERQAVRSKIRDAYASRCNSFEDLLQVACAIEEELLHISAPSRLDYFKSGFEFENRVKLKKDQLQGQLAALDAKRRPSSSPQPHGGNGGSGNSGPNSSPNGPSDGSYSAKKQRT